MTDFIQVLFLNSLCILGFHISTNENMIFGKVADWLEDKLPIWLNKPLWACPYCMSSIHSTYIAIPYLLYTEQSLWIYPIYITALCGMVALTYNVYEILRRYN
jgi:hypothetical protein